MSNRHYEEIEEIAVLGSIIRRMWQTVVWAIGVVAYVLLAIWAATFVSELGLPIGAAIIIFGLIAVAGIGGVCGYLEWLGKQPRTRRTF